MIQADEDGKGQVKDELDLGPYGKEKDMLQDRGGKEQGPIIKTQKFFQTQTFLDPTFFQDSRFFRPQNLRIKIFFLVRFLSVQLRSQAEQFGTQV